MARLRPYLPELALVLASALYGSTFVVVQDALDRVSASGFNVLRFATAAVVLTPVAVRRGWRGPEPRPTDDARVLVRVAIGLGLTSLVAYQTQNVGLHHTSTSNSGFITGLFVVFTPALVALRRRRWPAVRVTTAVSIAVLGLFLLTGARFDLGDGDAITVVCALAWSVWMVGTAEVTRRFDTVALILGQVVVVAVGSVVVAAGEGFGEVTGIVVVAVLSTGVGCSALAFGLSTWAQRVVEPERAGVINLFEPVVVGVIGFFVGERLGVTGYVGAALILVSMLVVERHTHDRDSTTGRRPSEQIRTRSASRGGASPAPVRGRSTSAAAKR